MRPFLIDKLELLLALAKDGISDGRRRPAASPSRRCRQPQAARGILGVMLVQRGSRFQGFTPEGERTLDWARRIVGDARAMSRRSTG